MFSKALWFYFVHHDGNRNNSGDEKWSSLVILAEWTLLLSQVVTRLDFASRDKDSKPEGSGGPAVLGVKCNVL